MQDKRRSAAVVLPVHMGDEGVALESSSRDGVKNEELPSLCQLVNTTHRSPKLRKPKRREEAYMVACRLQPNAAPSYSFMETKPKSYTLW